MTWELIGVPFTSARRPGGIADAIAVLRECGLAQRLAALGVEDGGDLELSQPSGERGASGLLNEAALAELVQTSESSVRELHLRDRRPLLIGGDCPVLLGPLAAIRAGGERPGLIMIDGHEDAWPPQRSETGEASDSEIALALGRVPELPESLTETIAVLTPSAIAQLGPRDRSELDAAGVPSLCDELGYFASGEDLSAGRESGETLSRRAIERVDADGFWLHIDLDVLATAEFRAVDYPQAGGLDWPELDRLSLAAAHDRRCRGVSVVIYNPTLDPDRADAGKLIDYIARLAAGARPSP